MNVKLFHTISLLLVLAFNPAQAQFLGDVFFKEPSIAIEKDAVGEVAISFFSGDRRFGAIRAEITYDPTALEIVSVEPLASAGISPTIHWSASENGLRFAVLQGSSLTDPIGSVNLLKIHFRAIGENGSQTLLASKPLEALDVESSPIQVGVGYSAEVSIGSIDPSAIGTAREQSLSADLAATTSLKQRAALLRPPGHAVKMLTKKGTSTFQQITVKTNPAAAITE